MNSFLIQQAIHVVAGLILGSDVFTHILGATERWSDKEISGLEKKAGVLAELEILGLKLANSTANFGVELAVQYLRTKA